MTVKTSIIAGGEALQINRMWTTVVHWYSSHEKNVGFNRRRKVCRKNHTGSGWSWTSEFLNRSLLTDHQVSLCLW